MRALVLLALAAQACATTPPAPAPLPEPQTFEEAVPFCVAKVNGKNVYSLFEASAQPGHLVSTFGTARQTFEFETCMNDHGYPLSSQGNQP